jgi:hypothetical protein
MGEAVIVAVKPGFDMELLLLALLLLLSKTLLPPRSPRLVALRFALKTAIQSRSLSPQCNG